MNETKLVYVFFAPGFEEIEAITPVDILRRGNIDVKTVSILEKKQVIGAHNIEISCDLTLNDISFDDLPDGIVFPGGMPGATNLANCKELKNLSEKCFDAGKLVCAICASPAIVFGNFGLLKNKNWTCYPNMEEEAPKEALSTWKTDPVAIDGNLISSRGPGTAAAFSYAILKELGYSEKAAALQQGMLFV